MTIYQVVNEYAEELSNWDFFSDRQTAYVDENRHIVVCLRNYNWYITKNPIMTNEDAIKALFEIDWIAEYDDCAECDDYEKYHFIDNSKFWKNFNDKKGK